MNYSLDPYVQSLTGTDAADLFNLNQYPQYPVTIDGGKGFDEISFGQALIGAGHFTFQVLPDKSVAISSASAFGEYLVKNIEQLNFANDKIRFYDELQVVKSSLGGFRLNETIVLKKSVDQTEMQVLQFDGRWSSAFLADAAGLLAWHQNPQSVSRNTALDGLTLMQALDALDRGLQGSERSAFIELVGLIADCQIGLIEQKPVPIFDGNFI